MLLKPNDIHFFNAAHQFVLAQEHDFDLLDLDTIYSLLTNYALNKDNQGDKTFTHIAAELYQNGLEKSYFHKQNASIINIYKNTTKLWIRCGQVARATAFLENKKNDFDTANLVFAHCLGLIHFHHAEYQKVIDGIKNLRFDDTFHKIDNHILLLRAYFYVDYDDFKNQFETTRKALQRAKGKPEIERHYQKYKNCIGILADIAKHNEEIRFKSKRYDIEDNRDRLKKKIAETTSIIYKAWLLAQIK